VANQAAFVGPVTVQLTPIPMPSRRPEGSRRARPERLYPLLYSGARTANAALVALLVVGLAP